MSRADMPGCHITAVDIHQPYLNDLVQKAAAVADPDTEALGIFSEREIAMYREHGDECGYQFFILLRR